MKKHSLINLLLLLMVVILALVVAYEPGIDEPQQLPKLVELQRDAIDHIVIRREGQDTVELQKDANGKWQLLQPIKTAASDFRIESLLRITEVKSLARFAADSDGLADYQLDKAGVELILNDTVHIAFGTNSPLDHRRYVLLQNQVQLISDTIYYHLIGDYSTFVRQRPLPEGASIDALQLPELMLRWQQQQWQLQPTPEHYTPDQITQLLDGWKYASAIRVKPYDGNSGESITVQLKGEDKPLQFLLTARQPDLILARPELGIQYHFPATAAEEMLQLPKATAEGDAAASGTLN